MPTALATASQQAATPRTVGFPHLRATLDTLVNWVTAETQAAFVATGVEPMVVTPTLISWRLTIAFYQNVSRVLLTPRHPLVDPPEYIDAVTGKGTSFYLRRVGGAYKLNGTDTLTQASFCAAVAKAIT